MTTVDGAGLTAQPVARPVLAHAAVQRVRETLDDLQVTSEIVVLDDSARTATMAAAALGVDVGQIANSLVFVTRDDPDSEPVPLLVLASGAHRVDTVKVAELLDVDAVERAAPDIVQASTGFVIGGVAPVGHTQPIRTLVDVALARYDTVWAAAGHPHAVFATTYDELLRITAGESIEAS